MKPLQLNLSRFHKIAEDDRTTTFQHHDMPHTITVGHSALPREMRADLKALPIYNDEADPTQSDEQSPRTQAMSKGGDVKANNKKEFYETLKSKKKSPSHSQKEFSETLKARSKNNLKGSDPGNDAQDDLAHYDGGGGVSASDSSDNTPTQPPIIFNIGAPNATPAPAPREDDFQYMMHQLGGETPDRMAQFQREQASAPTSPNQGVNRVPTQPVAQSPVQTSDKDSAQSTTQSPELSEAQKEIDAISTPPSSGAQQPQDQLNAAANNPNAQTPSYLAGYQQAVQGGAQLAQAQGALGEQEAAIEDQRAKSLQTISQNFHSAYSDLNTERDNMQADVEAKMINPDQYWDNHSKIAAGLGIILAGFNPTNRPNAALEFLQHSIDRDTNAQANNLNASGNMYAHFLQMFNNNDAAFRMTSALKQDQIAAQLRAAAARAQKPVQAATWLKTAGELQQSAAQRLIPLAAMQGAFQSMQQGVDPSPILPGLRIGAPELSKSIEAHMFPVGTYGGGGSTALPVPPDVIQQVAGQTNILNKVERLKDFIHRESIGDKLNPAERAEGNLLSGAVMQYYIKNTGASLSEGSVNHIKQMLVDNPNGLFNEYMNMPKIGALESELKDNINTIKSSYHFMPFKNQPGVEPQETPPALRAPGSEQSPAPEIRHIKNTPYTKVPGGWKRVTP